MVSIKESDHIFGMVIVKIFTPFLDDEKFKKKINKWNKVNYSRESKKPRIIMEFSIQENRD